MSKWRTMESAPRDGTTILGYMGKSAGPVKANQVPIHWSGWGGGVWENSTSGGRNNDPLAWRPMPKEPRDCYVQFGPEPEFKREVIIVE